MSFIRYKEYKQSGIEWLGETPSNWTVKRVGYFFNERREKVSDKDFQPLSVTKNGIVTQLETAAKSDDGDNRKKVCAGDFVINSRSDRKGSSGASPMDGSVSLINTVMTPNEDIDIKFAHNLFRSTSFQEEYYRYGKGIVADLWSTNYSEMKNISIAIPPLSEQRAIVNFLDHETTKIEMLITEQEKLIALLKEKRQSVISLAVTKGLNPNVEMKASGIEWLGAIPKNWDVRKASNFFTAKKGTNAAQLTKEYCSTVEGEYPVYSGQTENNGVMSEIDSYEFDSGEEGYLFATTVGAKAMTVSHIKGKFSLSQNCMVIIRTHSNLSIRFYYYHLQPLFFFERASIPDHMQPSFRMEDLYSYRIAIPPLHEQERIVEFLDSKVSNYANLISEANKSIDLLKERRSALISAAITGQIDVRKYQHKEAA